MDKESVQNLLGNDQLEEALEVLIREFKTGKKARSIRLLKGRLIELGRQNSRGTISSEAYAIEKNKIRAALFDISEGEENRIVTGSRKGGFRTILIVVFLVTMALASSYSIFGKKNDEQKIEKIKGELGDELITILLSEFSFREDREYKINLAYLRRSYEWDSEVALEIQPDDIQVVFIDTTKQPVIRIREGKLSSQLYVENKRSRTIQNSLWVEETSQDGKFWEEVNSLTKAKINDRLKKDVNQKERIRAAVEEAVRKRLETFPEIKVELGQVALYNGDILKY